MKKGWTYKKLGDVATYINGFPFKPSDWKEEGKPIIRIQNLTGNQSHYNRCDRKDIPIKYNVKKGDILISWSATLGVYVWELEDALLNQHIFKVVFDKGEINKCYFKFAIQNSIEEMSQHTNGATMKHIRKGDFDNILIPVPSLSEQQRIVERLDAAFADIDELKAKSDKQLAEAQALFQRTLTEEMKPKEGWEEKTLGDIAQVRIGPFGSLLHKKDYISGGIPLVNPIHMIAGKIVANNDYTISDEKAKELSNYLLKVNDIVFARRGEVGRCALVSKDEDGYLCGTGSLFVRFTNIVDFAFMLMLFQSENCRSYLEETASGATMLNINASIVENMPLAIPPFSEQQSIIERLNALSARVKELKEIQQKTITECDALKQAILREVFE